MTEAKAVQLQHRIESPTASSLPVLQDQLHVSLASSQSFIKTSNEPFAKAIRAAFQTAVSVWVGSNRARAGRARSWS